MTNIIAIRLALLVAACALATPVQAGNFSYMNDTPYTHFTSDDKKIFRESLNEALDKGADGESRTWSNPETRASGELKAVKTFERKGVACRTLSIANKAKGRSASGEYNFCKQKSGKWGLAN